MPLSSSVHKLNLFKYIIIIDMSTNKKLITLYDLIESNYSVIHVTANGKHKKVTSYMTMFTLKYK